MNEKLCVVVGVGPGLGLAVARRFAREGFTLALMARDAGRLAGYTAELPGAQAFSVDVANSHDVERAFAEVRAKLGEPSVLVFNAVGATFLKPMDLEPRQLTHDLAVGVSGALACAQQLIPAMKAAGRGSLLFTGGGSGLFPWPDGLSISIQKAAMRHLVMNLAESLKDTGVHVGTVTVLGAIAKDTHFDPDNIAEQFWQLHAQPAGSFEVERKYK